MIATQLGEILRVLWSHQVAFIVVGGAAAQLQGAPINTFDIDILYARSEENIDRLLAALTEIEAEFRGDISGRRLRPNASHLLSPGHKLLKTRFGQLDVLGTIEEATRYEEILGDVITLEIDGMAVQVLGLERLISVKQKAGRPKDLAVLPVLRATLERAKNR